MSFITRVGLTNWPAAGDTVSVYNTGDALIQGNRLTDILDREGGSLLSHSSGIYTVPADWLRLCTQDFARVDVYWHEGSQYLFEDAIIRNHVADVFVATGADTFDLPVPYKGRECRVIGTSNNIVTADLPAGTFIRKMDGTLSADGAAFQSNAAIGVVLRLLGIDNTTWLMEAGTMGSWNEV